MEELDIRRLYDEPPDIFRNVLLELDYHDILSVLRAMPTRLKDLNEGFWKQKGIQDLGIETTTREEYVEYITYSGDVVEGSEKYLDLNLSAMRAALFKDRYLMQYFLNKGADPSFVYYGLFSHKEKEDVMDVLQLVEPYAEKKGYYYFLALGLSLNKPAGWQRREAAEDLILEAKPSYELSGIVRGLSLNDISISRGAFWDLTSEIDRSYFHNPEYHKTDIISMDYTDHLKMAIFLSFLAKREENYKDMEKYMKIFMRCRYEETDFYQIGYVVSRSLLPEKKEWLIGQLQKLKDLQDLCSELSDNFAKEIEIGWHFGMFAQGYLQGYDIGIDIGSIDQVTLYTLITDILLKGYKKPIKELYHTFLDIPEDAILEGDISGKSILTTLSSLGLTDTLLYLQS